MKTQTRKSECRRIAQEYIRQHSPYEKTAPLGYNIAAMSRYARSRNIAIGDLSAQEAARFAIDKQQP